MTITWNNNNDDKIIFLRNICKLPRNLVDIMHFIINVYKRPMKEK